MAKQSGLGMNLYVGGNDLSGDTSNLPKIGGGPAALDFTSIDKLAFVRLGGERDGHIDWVSFFNPTGAHPVLSALPRTDVGVMATIGTTLGSPAACEVAKQIGYDPTRANNGMFTFTISTVSNGFGLEWGRLLTAGKRTDSAATNGTGVDDTTVSTAFGWQAYLQVFAMTGTDVTVKIQDSADNSSFADITSAAFTQITSGTPQSQRIAVGGTATVRRYLRASTVTSGGFSSLTFAVAFMRNRTAVAF
jgi:hypothetical protein